MKAKTPTPQKRVLGLSGTKGCSLPLDLDQMATESLLQLPGLLAKERESDSELLGLCLTNSIEFAYLTLCFQDRELVQEASLSSCVS